MTSQARTLSPLIADRCLMVDHCLIRGHVSACSVVKKAVRGKRRGPVKVKSRAMKIVGTALSNQRDLRAGRAAKISVGISCRDSEFLDRFCRSTQYRILRCLELRCTTAV